MASYTISPIWGAGAQLFDNSGRPLSGGKIYTYQAGTTTPAVTYTTPTGSVANSNPIVADSAGRLTNEIWLPVSGAYKFVLKTTNDVTLATYDSIPTTFQPPIVNDASSISYEQGYEVTAGYFTVGATYLITSVGSTNFVAIGAAANTVGVLFVATGIGSGTGKAAYVRTVQNRLQDSVSVKDFGAIGDGIADDTYAINAAVASVNGSAIYFPSGIYNHTGLNFSETIVFKGEGNTSVLKHTGSGIGVSIDAGETNFIYNVIIEDLTFDGNINTTIGLLTRSVHKSTFKNIRIAAATICGYQMKFGVCNSFESLIISTYIGLNPAPTIGIKLSAGRLVPTDGQCVDNIFINSIVEGVGTGIYLEQAIENTFLNGTSESNDVGIYFVATGGGGVDRAWNNTIVNMHFESNTTSDIQCYGYGNIFTNVPSSKIDLYNGSQNNIFTNGVIYNVNSEAGDPNQLNYITNAAYLGTISDPNKRLILTNVYSPYGPVYLPFELPYGASFPKTTPAAGMVANTFNWYETGNFTPVVYGGTTAGVGTYAYSVGKYTRIGNQVYFTIDLSVTAHTGTGAMKISGLPFTAIAGVPFSLIYGRWDNVTMAANYVPSGYVLNNVVEPQQTPVGGGTAISIALDTSFQLIVSGTYFVQ